MSSSCHFQIAQKLLEAVGRTRCIPLREGCQSVLATPRDFHSSLCKSIRSAQHRVSLATLYAGTGDKVHEHHLLQAVRDSEVPVQVVMDANRGTRPVRINDEAFTSSQEAVRQVADKLSLFQPLGSMAGMLPSPLNEVAGVFHVKAYVGDNKLLLSGANLSEDYFVDRQDRYIVFRDKELVDFYAELIDVLFDFGNAQPNSYSHLELLERLSELMRTDLDLDASLSNPSAWAIPTFQSPNTNLPFESDTEQLLSLLNATPESCSIRLASAYLNPTPQLLRALSKRSVPPLLLTAGPLSHGFAPKPGARRRNTWVPKVFETIAFDLVREHNLRIRWYEREGWTFHGKGVWIVTGEGNLVAAVIGSGNYGYRSEVLDVESNCILIFPNETSALQEELLEEWERLSDYSEEAKVDTLPSPLIRAALPLIRRFF